MGDYPDPEEEYELMYADELEMLQEDEDPAELNIVRKKPLPAKRSLDFSSPIAKKPIPTTDGNHIPSTTTIPNSITTESTDISLTPNLEPLQEFTPVSSKRTADDLFGDIGDIDFNEVELPSKRQKTDEENDMDLIEKILEGRRLKQSLLEPSGRMLGGRSGFKAKDNLSLNIPRWAFIPLTNSDGDRVYVRLEDPKQIISWQLVNPHLMREDRSQHQFKINLWAGIINGQIIGPFELPATLNAEYYLHFLRNELPTLLENIPEDVRQAMWLQNDGCPAHYATAVRAQLNETYPDRWIGRLGPILWPPRSPDLNPLDFFYWGCLKDKVYKQRITSEEELRQRIQSAVSEINNSHFVRRIRASFIRRCRLCILVGGRQFEHLL